MLKFPVHVIDTDPHRRNAVARLLYAQDEHAEIYDTLEEFLACSPETGIVMTHDAPDDDSATRILDALKDHRGFLPAILYSERVEPSMIVAAMTNGASDYMCFPLTPMELANALKQAMQFADANLEIELERREARERSLKLSKREKEVLIGLIRGGSNKMIAKTLGLSPRTVEIHRANTFQKLDAKNAADAVRLGLYAGLDESTEFEDFTIAC